MSRTIVLNIRQIQAGLEHTHGAQHVPVALGPADMKALDPKHCVVERAKAVSRPKPANLVFADAEWLGILVGSFDQEIVAKCGFKNPPEKNGLLALLEHRQSQVDQKIAAQEAHIQTLKGLPATAARSVSIKQEEVMLDDIKDMKASYAFLARELLRRYAEVQQLIGQGHVVEAKQQQAKLVEWYRQFKELSPQHRVESEILPGRAEVHDVKVLTDDGTEATVSLTGWPAYSGIGAKDKTKKFYSDATAFKVMEKTAGFSIEQPAAKPQRPLDYDMWQKAMDRLHRRRKPTIGFQQLVSMARKYGVDLSQPYIGRVKLSANVQLIDESKHEVNVSAIEACVKLHELDKQPGKQHAVKRGLQAVMDAMFPLAPPVVVMPVRRRGPVLPPKKAMDVTRPRQLWRDMATRESVAAVTASALKQAAPIAAAQLLEDKDDALSTHEVYVAFDKAQRDAVTKRVQYLRMPSQPVRATDEKTMAIADGRFKYSPREADFYNTLQVKRGSSAPCDYLNPDPQTKHVWIPTTALAADFTAVRTALGGVPNHPGPERVSFVAQVKGRFVFVDLHVSDEGVPPNVVAQVVDPARTVDGNGKADSDVEDLLAGALGVAFKLTTPITITDQADAKKYADAVTAGTMQEGYDGVIALHALRCVANGDAVPALPAAGEAVAKLRAQQLPHMRTAARLPAADLVYDGRTYTLSDETAAKLEQPHTYAVADFPSVKQPFTYPDWLPAADEAKLTLQEEQQRTCYERQVLNHFVANLYFQLAQGKVVHLPEPGADGNYGIPAGSPWVGDHRAFMVQALNDYETFALKMSRATHPTAGSDSNKVKLQRDAVMELQQAHADYFLAFYQGEVSDADALNPLPEKSLDFQMKVKAAEPGVIEQIYIRPRGKSHPELCHRSAKARLGQHLVVIDDASLAEYEAAKTAETIAQAKFIDTLKKAYTTLLPQGNFDQLLQMLKSALGEDGFYQLMHLPIEQGAGIIDVDRAAIEACFAQCKDPWFAAHKKQIADALSAPLSDDHNVGQYYFNALKAIGEGLRLADLAKASEYTISYAGGAADDKASSMPELLYKLDTGQDDYETQPDVVKQQYVGKIFQALPYQIVQARLQDMAADSSGKVGFDTAGLGLQSTDAMFDDVTAKVRAFLNDADPDAPDQKFFLCYSKGHFTWVAARRSDKMVWAMDPMQDRHVFSDDPEKILEAKEGSMRFNRRLKGLQRALLQQGSDKDHAAVKGVRVMQLSVADMGLEALTPQPDPIYCADYAVAAMESFVQGGPAWATAPQADDLEFMQPKLSAAEEAHAAAAKVMHVVPAVEDKARPLPALDAAQLKQDLQAGNDAAGNPVQDAAFVDPATDDLDAKNSAFLTANDNLFLKDLLQQRPGWNDLGLRGTALQRAILDPASATGQLAVGDQRETALREKMLPAVLAVCKQVGLQLDKLANFQALPDRVKSVLCGKAFDLLDASLPKAQIDAVAAADKTKRFAACAELTCESRPGYWGSFNTDGPRLPNWDKIADYCGRFQIDLEALHASKQFDEGLFDRFALAFETAHQLATDAKVDSPSKLKVEQAFQRMCQQLGVLQAKVRDAKAAGSANPYEDERVKAEVARYKAAYDDYRGVCAQAIARKNYRVVFDRHNPAAVNRLINLILISGDNKEAIKLAVVHIASAMGIDIAALAAERDEDIRAGVVPVRNQACIDVLSKVAHQRCYVPRFDDQPPVRHAAALPFTAATWQAMRQKWAAVALNPEMRCRPLWAADRALALPNEAKALADVVEQAEKFEDDRPGYERTVVFPAETVADLERRNSAHLLDPVRFDYLPDQWRTKVAVDCLAKAAAVAHVDLSKFAPGSFRKNLADSFQTRNTAVLFARLMKLRLALTPRIKLTNELVFKGGVTALRDHLDGKLNHLAGHQIKQDGVLEVPPFDSAALDARNAAACDTANVEWQDFFDDHGIVDPDQKSSIFSRMRIQATALGINLNLLVTETKPGMTGRVKFTRLDRRKKALSYLYDKLPEMSKYLVQQAGPLFKDLMQTCIPVDGFQIEPPAGETVFMNLAASLGIDLDWCLQSDNGMTGLRQWLQVAVMEAYRLQMQVPAIPITAASLIGLPSIKPMADALVGLQQKELELLRDVTDVNQSALLGVKAQLETGVKAAKQAIRDDAVVVKYHQSLLVEKPANQLVDEQRQLRDAVDAALATFINEGRLQVLAGAALQKEQAIMRGYLVSFLNAHDRRLPEKEFWDSGDPDIVKQREDLLKTVQEYGSIMQPTACAQTMRAAVLMNELKVLAKVEVGVGQPFDRDTAYRLAALLPFEKAIAAGGNLDGVLFLSPQAPPNIPAGTGLASDDDVSNDDFFAADDAGDTRKKRWWACIKDNVVSDGLGLTDTDKDRCIGRVLKVANGVGLNLNKFARVLDTLSAKHADGYQKQRVLGGFLRLAAQIESGWMQPLLSLPSHKAALQNYMQALKALADAAPADRAARITDVNKALDRLYEGVVVTKHAMFEQMVAARDDFYPEGADENTIDPRFLVAASNYMAAAIVDEGKADPAIKAAFPGIGADALPLVRHQLASYLQQHKVLRFDYADPTKQGDWCAIIKHAVKYDALKGEAKSRGLAIDVAAWNEQKSLYFNDRGFIAGFDCYRDGLMPLLIDARHAPLALADLDKQPRADLSKDNLDANAVGDLTWESVLKGEPDLEVARKAVVAYAKAFKIDIDAVLQYHKPVVGRSSLAKKHKAKQAMCLIAKHALAFDKNKKDFSAAVGDDAKAPLYAERLHRALPLGQAFYERVLLGADISAARGAKAVNAAIVSNLVKPNNNLFEAIETKKIDHHLVRRRGHRHHWARRDSTPYQKDCRRAILLRALMMEKALKAVGVNPAENAGGGLGHFDIRLVGLKRAISIGQSDGSITAESNNLVKCFNALAERHPELRAVLAPAEHVSAHERMRAYDAAKQPREALREHYKQGDPKPGTTEYRVKFLKDFAEKHRKAANDSVFDPSRAKDEDKKKLTEDEETLTALKMMRHDQALAAKYAKERKQEAERNHEDRKFTSLDDQDKRQLDTKLLDNVQKVSGLYVDMRETRSACTIDRDVMVLAVRSTRSNSRDRMSIERVVDPSTGSVSFTVTSTPIDPTQKARALAVLLMREFYDKKTDSDGNVHYEAVPIVIDSFDAQKLFGEKDAKKAQAYLRDAIVFVHKSLPEFKQDKPYKVDDMLSFGKAKPKPAPLQKPGKPGTPPVASNREVKAAHDWVNTNATMLKGGGIDLAELKKMAAMPHGKAMFEGLMSKPLDADGVKMLKGLVDAASHASPAPGRR